VRNASSPTPPCECAIRLTSRPGPRRGSGLIVQRPGDGRPHESALGGVAVASPVGASEVGDLVGLVAHPATGSDSGGAPAAMLLSMQATTITLTRTPLRLPGGASGVAARRCANQSRTPRLERRFYGSRASARPPARARRRPDVNTARAPRLRRRGLAPISPPTLAGCGWHGGSARGADPRRARVNANNVIVSMYGSPIAGPRAAPCRP